MQSTSTEPSNPGRLVAAFYYGKAFLIVFLVLGVVMLGMAPFVL